MAQQASDDDDIVTGINVTPLVDIMLVLRVVFMGTAKLISSQEIPMDPPKAATAGAIKTVLTVSVAHDGTVLANGVRTDGDDALQAVARGLLAKTPELRTTVQASTAVPYGTVLHVMDALCESGVQKIAFATEPKPARADR